MTIPYPRAGFRRRFAALIYDSLVAISVFAVTHFIVFAIVAVAYVINPTIIGEYADVGAYLTQARWHKAVLFLAVCYFFIWFWTHGGQTIGMRAWRLRVQNEDGTLISAAQGITRLVFAFGGLGNVILIVNRKQKKSVQDYLSHSEMIVLKKEDSAYKDIR
ncbi:RDD family protein [Algicola sagamiensis]|uniref:RDD family protein n=1 Tax=Algicola sagamiensis TaxID=163869 RepID=UPI0003744508|nr:RDD family protein [Algicola sagamiensis]